MGGNAIYEVEVINTGNSPNTMLVMPADRDSLNSMGWDIMLASDSESDYSDSISVTVGPNSTKTVIVKLIPVAEVPAYDVRFSLSIKSDNGIDDEASISAELPSVEIKGDLDFGDEKAQVWNPQPMDLTPIYWAIGIVYSLQPHMS